jgi:6-phosphogluconolactonase (cycloisomerase 2 family)
VVDQIAYVGCRTSCERNARGAGISVFRIDGAGQWHLIAVEETRPNPAFLAVDRNGPFLYAVHGDGTAMSSFRIEDDGRLRALDHATTAGLNPVDAVLDASGRHLVVTNHISGSVVAHRLTGDGHFGPIASYAQIVGPLGPHRTEQALPKPHQTIFDRTGRRLFVPNKGTDTVSVFDFEGATGSLVERPALAARLREGSGPRNGVAHPAVPALFVVGELDSAVYALRIGQDGELQPYQVLSTLPESFIGFSRASAVVLSPDGAHLHVSNRGHDSICTFDIAEEGRLAGARWTPTEGRTPRFACVDPHGVALLVANEDSDTIVSLPIDGRGQVTVIAQTPSPTCIVFRWGEARPR